MATCSLGANCGRPENGTVRWLCCQRCPDFYHLTCCSHLDGLGLGDFKEDLDELALKLFVCAKCLPHFTKVR